MTNKEAIKVLESTDGVLPKNPFVSDVKLKKALTLAIKALEEKPQGKWEDYSGDFYKCPECGYLLNKLCPQCHNKVILPKGGAEMRVKDELNNELNELGGGECITQSQVSQDQFTEILSR